MEKYFRVNRICLNNQKAIFWGDPSDWWRNILEQSEYSNQSESCIFFTLLIGGEIFISSLGGNLFSTNQYPRPNKIQYFWLTLLINGKYFWIFWPIRKQYFWLTLLIGVELFLTNQITIFLVDPFWLVERAHWLPFGFSLSPAASKSGSLPVLFWWKIVLLNLVGGQIFQPIRKQYSWLTCFYWWRGGAPVAFWLQSVTSRLKEWIPSCFILVKNSFAESGWWTNISTNQKTIFLVDLFLLVEGGRTGCLLASVCHQPPQRVECFILVKSLVRESQDTHSKFLVQK